MLLSLSSIAILPRQRKTRDIDKVQSLAASIKSNGLYHPIVVRRPFDSEQLTEGQVYVLCIGGGRIAAHHLLGRTEIEANLKENLDPIRAKIVELEENIEREDLGWQDVVAARAEIDELYKKLFPTSTLEDRAGLAGVSKAQLSKDVALHKAVVSDPTLKAAASKGSAIRTAAYKSDIRERVQRAEAAKDGTSDLRSKLVIARGEEWIKTVPDQSVDMVFSDLPYGIDYFGVMKEGTGSGSVSSVYDDTAGSAKNFIAAIVPDLVRVVKPTGWIVLFMCYEWHQWLQDEIRKTERSPEMPPWIWTRRGKGNHGHWPELHASSRYEMLVVVNGGGAKLAKKPVENVLDFAPFDGERHHAMQKPHDLCRELIERCTVAGETVLDVCFGSGAHLAAAASLGRNFLGCEKNAEMLPAALTLVGQYYKGSK